MWHSGTIFSDNINNETQGGLNLFISIRNFKHMNDIVKVGTRGTKSVINVIFFPFLNLF